MSKNECKGTLGGGEGVIEYVYVGGEEDLWVDSGGDGKAVETEGSHCSLIIAAERREHE